MEKKKLIEEKEEMFKDILRQRDELKAINEQINEIGASVTFVQFFIIPLLAAIIVALLVNIAGADQSQKVGAVLVTFIVAFAISTIYNKRRIASKKQELIDRRVAVQRDLAAMGKRLAEIETELKN